MDEIRREEDYEPLGFNYIQLGLGDVLLNPQTMEVFTPNTGQTTALGEVRARNYKRDSLGRFAGNGGGGGGNIASMTKLYSNGGAKPKEKVDKSAKSDIIELKDIEIGKSVGAKSKNYDILDPATGEYFHFAEGSKIQNAQVFAGKGCKKPLEKVVSEGLAQQIGGKPEKWQHAKGHGVIDFYGEERKAEVHWFQEESVGKHKFKIKEWED